MAQYFCQPLYIEDKYRNRVQYGSKVIVRLSSDHIVVFNVPTGEFLIAPKENDLYETIK